MSSANENQKRKSKRALWVGVLFAFVFAITWGFPSGFGLVTFFISAYCFFLAWYWQPRAPRPSSFRGNRGQGGFSGTIQVEPKDVVKQVVRFIALGIFGLVAFLIVAEILAGGDEQEQSIYEIEESDQFDQSTEDISSTSRDWIAVGNEFYAQERFDSAEFYYDRMLKDDPENAVALYNKGLTRYERQDVSTAWRLLEQSYELGMRTTFLSQELAKKYEGAGNTMRAVAFYKEAVGQDSTLVDVYNRLAQLDPENGPTYVMLAQKFNSGTN